MNTDTDIRWTSAPGIAAAFAARKAELAAEEARRDAFFANLPELAAARRAEREAAPVLIRRGAPRRRA